MKRVAVLSLLAALAKFSSASAQVAADDTSTIPVAASHEWRTYVEPMLPIGERMAPLMEDSKDPLLRQEMYRLVFSGMSAGYMGLLYADPAYPDFWPVFNQAYNFWGLNPDDTYYATPIDPNGTYKISGFRGTVKIVDFGVATGQLIPRGLTAQLDPVLSSYDLDRDVHINKKDGSFETILSAERPKGYKGDWWKLEAKATFLLVRQVSYDWLHEIDGRFAIERLDRPAIKPRPTAQELEANMRSMSEWAENWTKFPLLWVKKFRAKGLVNKVAVSDFTSYGALAKQGYIEGMFELKPDEALIYETEMPKQCRYWNISLTDMLWSLVDYMNRQSSLNGYTARLDKDGKFRAVISATDPGVPNWLDTAGYATGSLFGRWKECSSMPVPVLTKVKLAEVRNYLPADTPIVTAEERDAAIRLRRKGAQLRRRW